VFFSSLGSIDWDKSEEPVRNWLKLDGICRETGLKLRTFDPTRNSISLQFSTKTILILSIKLPKNVEIQHELDNSMKIQRLRGKEDNEGQVTRWIKTSQEWIAQELPYWKSKKKARIRRSSSKWGLIPPNPEVIFKYENPRTSTMPQQTEIKEESGENTFMACFCRSPALKLPTSIA
jgi:hypothetical protein